MPARPSWGRKVATTRRGSVHWRKPFVPQRFQGGSQRPRRRRDRALAGARWPSGSRGKEGARGGTMDSPALSHGGGRKPASAYGEGWRTRCAPPWTWKTRWAWPSDGSLVSRGYDRPVWSRAPRTYDPFTPRYVIRRSSAATSAKRRASPTRAPASARMCTWSNADPASERPGACPNVARQGRRVDHVDERSRAGPDEGALERRRLAGDEVREHDDSRL